MKPETKYRGAIKLSAIGDALGWMTEFVNNKSDLEKRFGVSEIDHFHNWSKQVGGRFNGYEDHIKSGAYSDDTQLLLAVARSIDDKGTVDNEYFSKVEFANWLSYARGGGRTVKNAAKKIQRKSATWYNNFFSFKVGKTTVDSIDSGANGVAMRILPIALANHQNFSKTHSEVFKNGIITHGHPRALVGASLYAYCIEQALMFRPEDFDRNQFLTLIGKTVDTALALNQNALGEAAQWIKHWEKEAQMSFQTAYDNVVKEAHQGLQDVWKMLQSEISEEEALKELGCFNPETRSSGISTVLGGIYIALRYPTQPLVAVSKAVNCLGTDTDSIAAFVGGIVGAIHGHNIIPDRWKKVQDWEYLDDIAMHLARISFDEGNGNEKLRSKDIVNTLEAVLAEGNPRVDTQVVFPALGQGHITGLDIQHALTSGKYNVIVDVEFENGQSCRFSKLLNGEIPQNKKILSPDLNELILEFESELNSNEKNMFRKILLRLKN